MATLKGRGALIGQLAGEVVAVNPSLNSESVVVFFGR